MNTTDLLVEFERRFRTPSDINEHLGVLADFARKCSTVVEFGTREGNSTVALLRGLDDVGGSLLTIDVDPAATATVQNAFDPDGTGTVGNVTFTAMTADTRTLAIQRSVDMIFIDTLHTYQQLKQELILHGNKATKYLAFHDTYTFGEQGEDGLTPGLWQAIDEFATNSQLRLGVTWKPVWDALNNNGLLVLERQPIDAPEETPVRNATSEEKAYTTLDAVLEAGGAYEVGFTGDKTVLKVIWTVQIPGQEKPNDFVYSATSDKGLAVALDNVRGILKTHLDGLQKLAGKLG